MSGLYRIEALYLGLDLLFKHRSQIDFSDSDFYVIHKTAQLSSAPEHSNSGYISVATLDELPNHEEILGLGWSYDYPYYIFYMY